MKVDIIISQDDIKKEKILNKTAVVIDMLRATSVIITALYNGARCVKPFLTIEEALNEAKKFSREEYILGGERRAVKIDGFDFSNSPLEYTPINVKNKTVIITTTNGTRTLTKCTKADKIIISAVINAEASAKKLSDDNKDIVIVNAGTNGNFSMDDYICSGYIIDRLLEINSDIELTDISKTALMIYRSNKDILSFIKNARHYGVMKKLKLDDDIDYCIKKDIVNIVPEYRDGSIQIYD